MEESIVLLDNVMVFGVTFVRLYFQIESDQKKLKKHNQGRYDGA